MEGSLIAVADASFLINFLNFDRMDLIARHPSQFLVTDHIHDDVINKSQKIRLEKAFETGILEKHTVITHSEDLDLFSRLRKEKLGYGESSAIAFALYRGYALAIDDSKAIRIAKKFSKALKIIRTQDLSSLLIQENLIDIQEADNQKLVIHQPN